MSLAGLDRPAAPPPLPVTLGLGGGEALAICCLYSSATSLFGFLLTLEGDSLPPFCGGTIQYFPVSMAKQIHVKLRAIFFEAS